MKHLIWLKMVVTEGEGLGVLCALYVRNAVIERCPGFPWWLTTWTIALFQLLPMHLASQRQPQSCTVPRAHSRTRNISAFASLWIPVRQ